MRGLLNVNGSILVHLFLRLNSTIFPILVLQRTILRDRPFIFTYLRHLRLELVLHGHKKRKTDVLDYAYLLEVAPLLEKLELHVSFFLFFIGAPPPTHTPILLVYYVYLS